MRPTVEDLKAIWLLCYCRSAFIEASERLENEREIMLVAGFGI